MKRMLKDWLVALLLGAAVYLGILALQPSPDIPDKAPGFSLRSLDGNPLDLSEMRGRMVVINFWATWCGPCKTEVPDFSRFADANPDVTVIGLAVDSGSESAVRRTAEDWGIRYPVAMADSALQQRYDITTLPTTVVIGPDGQVRDITVGTMSERALVRATR